MGDKQERQLRFSPGKIIPALNRDETRMQNTAEYTCAYCGEQNLTFVDLSAGGQQSYVEDCQVCCRPNVLYVRVDEETLDIEIDSEYEG
jgi:5-methylcytosine-specific restriction endonuclease McrA